MKTVVVATRSSHKLAELRACFPILPGIRLIDLDQAGLSEAPDEEAIEVFSTFQENALAKARYFLDRGADYVLADDSGLCVDALDGAPGVRSKRFSGRADLSGVSLDRANNDHLLRLLYDVPEPRTAHYVCALALASVRDRGRVFLGTVDGEILRAPQGDGGFGYDPLFFVPEFGQTFGQVDSLRKNSVSHRARAAQAATPALGDIGLRLRPRGLDHPAIG